MPVLGVGVARLAERGDRFIALAELLANVGKREPRRGEARRKLDRLFEQIGGSGEISLELQVARKVEAPIGYQIAGRHEQADGHLLGTGPARLEWTGRPPY